MTTPLTTDKQRSHMKEMTMNKAEGRVYTSLIYERTPAKTAVREPFRVRSYWLRLCCHIALRLMKTSFNKIVLALYLLLASQRPVRMTEPIMTAIRRSKTKEMTMNKAGRRVYTSLMHTCAPAKIVGSLFPLCAPSPADLHADRQGGKQ